MRIPEGWPGEDVNVCVWSHIERVEGRRPRTAWRIRVTHRATGASCFAVSRDGRRGLAAALVVARRRARAYEAVGLADLAVTVREWQRRGIPAG